MGKDNKVYYGKNIGHYISILYRLGGMHYSKEFAKFNIGSGQFGFLSYVFEHNGVSQECISNNLLMDKGTTARALKKLEEEGYIKREIDLKDKRIRRVFVTEKALGIEDEFFVILKSWSKIISSDFTEDEKNTLLNLFKRMVDNQKEVLIKER
ncbi:MarR family winged helix-turn-helix transcriptional regulator [Clostridium algidicarnis]|uniref:MarR family winged helix-turn-helix transcriptional regulator n=1 Tax=Clostridium algidicarnis TaxID=37659 RepID=UPI001C0BB82A|nr:MarR family transcriptional regulator [Clostridium algidicarnis]MBU3210380.1 MarR family transcriptional regulator [Clostridium algidicarnis]MBU3228352.1 MarR family transcriptional regulator [Clostridium algidicarnis]MBU3251409.1 MarR family transcriptional regulator [Clostridium algidicarnis]